MKSRFDNILVISLQGIGDLLLATPLLHGLKTSYAGAKLTVLTLEANKGVLDGNPDADQVITFKAADRTNVAEIVALLGKIRREKFDLAICVYPSGLRSAFIAYLSGAKERLGQDLSLFKNFRWLFTRMVSVTEVKHAVLMNLDFLSALGLNLSEISTEVNFYINDDDSRFAKEFLRSNGVSDSDKVIAVHAGGGEYTIAYRNWPLDRFAKAADVLSERHKAKIVFIGGKNDNSSADYLMKLMKQKAVIAVGKMSLKQTAALLTKTKLLLCNNSGPMHIAAALKVRTVSIFGSADPRIHRPWGKDHIILQNPLECSPCYYPFFRDTLEETERRNSWAGKKFICKSGDYRCLTSISTDQVIEAVVHVIKDN